MTSPISISLTEESRKAWIASILFHLLLLFIFYLVQVDSARREGGFVEVTLGGFSEATTARTAEETSGELRGAPSRAAPRVTVKRPSAMKLDLPERRFPVAEEPLRLPEMRKLDVAERSVEKPDEGTRRAVLEEKEIGAGKTVGGERLAGDGKRAVASEAGSGIGSEVGRAIGYSIQWAGGGTRLKISGDLPVYPEGVNIEAQIRLQAVVAPDGSVKSLQPIQKAHVRLEEAAMKEVRFWKFEPLDFTQPQIDQTCVIIFNFKLK